MMNDENITFLFYPLKLYQKFIIDELFRFSLAVSALETMKNIELFKTIPPMTRVMDQNSLPAEK